MSNPTNFRGWQHWRWSKAGDKQTPSEKAIKSHGSCPSEQPKKDK